MSDLACLRCGAPLDPGSICLCAPPPSPPRLDLAREPVRLVAPPSTSPDAPREPGWTCRHCQAETAATEAGCRGCGLPRVLPPRSRPPRVRDDRPVELGPLTLPRPVFYLALGLLLALLVHAVMCGVFDFGVQVTVHECGHALAGWAFGRPAIPLPFIGFTVWQEQSVLLALLVWAGLGGLVWRERERRRRALALGALALLYPLVAFSAAHEYVIAAAGHGSEVVAACWLLWIALEGRARYQDLERAVAAMCAWLLLAGNLTLFLQLSFSRAAQHRYQTESVLGVDNDFVQVARALHLRLPTVSFLFVLVMLTLAAATLGAWWRWRWRPSQARRAQAEPAA